MQAKYGEDVKSHCAHWLAFEQCALSSRWVAIIDVDEFIVPKADGSIEKFLSRFGRGVNQILLGWDIYGSNGHVEKPAGLVMENYLMKGRMDDSYNFKSIVDPRAIVIDNNHFHQIVGATVDEAGRVVRRKIHSHRAPADLCPINHYITRSRAECRAKCAKNENIYPERYANEYFKLYDRNDVRDDFMLRYAGIVREKLGMK